ncbi:MAG: hypothetical protein WCA49_11385 [Candidatus Sulfotelmatobacter sp.]
MKKRFVFLPLFLAALGFSVFLRSNGSDHVRTVQILTLIAIGMCLGIALANLLALFNAKSKD